jgi:hypothetical protein
VSLYDILMCYNLKILTRRAVKSPAVWYWHGTQSLLVNNPMITGYLLAHNSQTHSCRTQYLLNKSFALQYTLSCSSQSIIAVVSS